MRPETISCERFVVPLQIIISLTNHGFFLVRLVARSTKCGLWPLVSGMHRIGYMEVVSRLKVQLPHRGEIQ